MESNSILPPSLRLTHLWPIADRVELARIQAPARPKYQPGSLAEFASKTKIEVPHGESVALIPFDLWPAQADVLGQMAANRLLVILKARQLGISWLTCLYVLYLCVTQPGRTVLLLSRGQLEANELIHRIGVLESHHKDRAEFPELTTDNTGELEWANGSRVLSLAATKNAGRGFTASLVVLDEYAFMTFGQQTLASVKPTIDAGGKLFIISSADGNGSPYHQFWQAAERGTSGYVPIFLPWHVRPERAEVPGWRDQKILEANGDTAAVLREYPESAIEAFTHAVGLIYGVWRDAPGQADSNVTEDADYIPGAGPVLWFVDDGYSGKLDRATGTYTAESHPRVFLLIQVRPDGTLCQFAESYAVEKLSDQHITEVQGLCQIAGYPAPDFAAVDKSAAELKGRLMAQNIYTRNGPSDVEESIKEFRRALAPDANGRRRYLVHPRCKHFRIEMASYRRDANGRVVKAFDHGPDAARYGVWTQRFEV